MYTHRLGRTGRAGKKGKGLLVLLPFEESRANGLQRRGVEYDLEMANLIRGSSTNKDIMEAVHGRVQSGNALLLSSAEAACLSFLAYYIPNSCGLESAEILQYAKTFARCTGLPHLPPVDAKLASRLKLDGLTDDIAMK